MSNPSSIPSDTNLITELDVATAALLAKRTVYSLELNCINSLTPEVARELGRFEGDQLELNGIKSLTPEVARELGRFEGGQLELNGLTSLSEAAAAALASYKGSLGLMITELDVATAALLAKRTGYSLELNGIKSLTPEVARELVRFEGGQLELNGLTSFSDAVAVALASYNGSLHLSDAGWAQFKFGQQLVRRADYQASRPLKAKSKDLFNKGLMTFVTPEGRMAVDLWPEGRLFLLQPEDWFTDAMESPDLMVELNPRNLDLIIDSFKITAMRHCHGGEEFDDVFPEAVADIRWLRKHVSVARCVGTAVDSQAPSLAKKPKTPQRSRPQAKPKKQQGTGEGPLAGRVFCFTGRLEGMSRAEAEGKVKALGAATADSITKKVTDVVVGADAGSKRAKALEMGLKVHDQEAFESLLRGLA